MMRHLYNYTLSLVLTFFLLATNVTAQWNSNTTINTPVQVIPNGMTAPQMAPDGSGGTYLVWTDVRSGTHIYAQHLNSAGVALWATDGIPICVASSGNGSLQDQTNPSIIADGSGGAIIAWQDIRDNRFVASGNSNTAMYSIYAQKVNSAGTIQWATNGALVATSTNDCLNKPFLASDGAGGAFVAYSGHFFTFNNNSGYQDHYIQRINSAGTVWASPVALQYDHSMAIIYPGARDMGLVEDGSGGAYVQYYYGPYEAASVYLNRVTSTGTTWASPTQLTQAGSNSGVPGSKTLVLDGAGGVISTFVSNGSIKAQRVNSAGAIQWTGSPLGVNLSPTYSTNNSTVSIVSNGSGGGIIAWMNYRTNNWQVYAQQITSAGTIPAGWGTDGNLVNVTTTFNMLYPDMVSDGNNGAIITWQDTRSGNDVYAQRINNSGARVWTPNGNGGGIAIGTNTASQGNPVITTNGSNGAIIAFPDNRNSIYYTTLYAQNVNADGTVGPPCIAPTTPTLSATSSTICNGASTTLSIASGTLNSATAWQWYTASCGGTSAGSGTSITVSPTTTTTYYARGEGGCVVPGTCASITITVNSSPVITPSTSSVTICNGVSTTLTASSSSNGFAASYYNNTTLSGSPSYTTSEMIDFNWGTGSPNVAVPADLFSARWTGTITAPVAGSYVFTTVSDDGVRLYIDGNLVINNWSDHAPTTDNSSPITFTANSSHTVVLEFYENGGGAVISLSWSYPGQSTTIIPVSATQPAYSWSNGATGGAITVSPASTTTYTVTATNTAGCTATATRTVNVNPNPTASITGTATACTSVSLTASGGTSYAWSGGATPTTAANTFTTNGTYSVTVTGTGGCTATAQQAVVVNTLPTFTTCPNNITQSAAVGACNAAVTYTAAATGTPAPTISYSFTGATTGSGSGTGSGTTFNRGVTTVTLIANNTCGNSTACTFTVTVNDITPPTITCAANVTINTTAGLCTGTTTLTNPTVTENCAPTNNALNLDGSNDFVDLGNPASFQINTGTVEAWIKTANAGTGYRAIVVKQSAYSLFLKDNILILYDWSGGDRTTGINLADNQWHHVAASFQSGVTGGTTIYIDGNLALTTQTTIVSQGASTRIGDGNVAGQNINGTIDGVRIWNVTRTQAQIQAAMSQQLISGTGLVSAYYFNQGIAGGTNTGITTLNDAVGSNNGTLNGLALTGATSNWVAGASAIVAGYTLTNNAPTAFPKGNTTVTWTATDLNGNSATCTQTVTVVDNQAPTLACVANQTLNAAAGTCSQTYTITDPITDNCTGSTWGYTLAGATTGTVTGIADGANSSAITFNRGVTTVTLTGTDGTNAATTCSFTVTVNDVTPPSITCAANVTINTTAGLCTGTTTLTAPTVTDNCGVNVLNFDGSNDYVGIPSSTGINSRFASNRITVEAWVYLTATPVGLPMVVGESYQGDGLVRYALFFQGQNVYAGMYPGSWIQVGSSTTVPLNTWTHIASTYDQTSIKVYINGNLVGNLGTSIAIPNGTEEWRIGRRWDFADQFNGNMRDVRIWNVARTQAEIATGMNSGVTTSTPGLVSWYTMNQGIANSNNTAITSLTDAVSNYGGIFSGFALNGTSSNFINGTAATITNNAPTTFPKGTTTVTWTATDASGNSATCNQTVTVVDNQAPTLACVANQTLNAAAGACTQTYIIADPITDNCTGSTWGYTLSGATTATVTGIADGTSSGAVTFNRGVTTVTLTGTDGTNAAATCSFTVTVNDVTPPTITCAPNVTINTTAGTCTGTTTLTAPTVTDNCTTPGNALNFDGNSDRVSVPAYPSMSNVTLETWIRGNAFSGFNALLDQTWTSGAFHFQMSNGAVGFSINGNNPTDFVAGSVSTNTWTHIAMVYEAGPRTAKLYINGTLIQTMNYTTAINIGAQPGNIGSWDNSRYFSGDIDNFRIWNVARTASEIASNMNTTLTTQAGLIANYTFNQGTAGGNNAGITTATDASGSGYNGTLNTFALTGATSNWVSGAPTMVSGYTLTNNAPANYPIGNTTVTWTATDAAGNSATCNQTVTVIDNIAPTITCAADVTINTTPGLCTGTTTLTAPTATDNCGVVGNALSFDGVNDNIDVTIDANEAAYTAEFWFKTTTSTCGLMMHDGQINGLGGGNDRHIYLTNGNIGARLWSNEVITTSGTNYADGNWHHIAYTFGTGVGAQRIYVDGVLKVTGTLSASSWNGNSINIGASVDVSPNYFTGLMDEVRIWNVARTQAQILANMNTTISPSTSGLQAYYRFDQGIAGGNNTAITTATNNQGNAALNGNLMGFTMNGASSNFVASTAPVSGVTITNNAPATYPIGNTTVTWTATDAAGNASTCNQIVTVVAPEINVTGNATSIVDGDATPSATDHTDFGNVNLNASVTRTFTIQNTGTSSLTVSTITSTGTNASNFVVGGITLPATVAAGASTTFTVVFTATAIGTPTATITVNNSDCNEAVYDFAVQASVTCAPPVISISGTTTACNTVTLTASAPGATAYAWSGGSSTNTAANTFSTSGTYTVTVTGTVACTASASSVVTVNASPAAPAVSPASITACQNEAINLTIPAAVGGVNYTWSPAGTLFTNSTGTTAYVAGNSATSLYAIVPNVVATYTVTATSAAGCTSTGSATVNTNFASSNVILAPSTAVSGAHHLQTSCEDANWTYYENPSNPGKYLFAINWNPNGGAALNATQKALTLNPGASAFGVFIDNQSPVSGTPAITVSPGTYNTGNGTIGWYESTSPSTSQATFAMQRYWNVNVGGGMLPEPVNVRFYFDTNEYDAVVNAATAWSLANGGYVEAPKWFKTVGAPDGVNNSWNPGSDLDPITVEHSGWVMDLNPLVSGYGFDNGIRYVQFNSVPSFSGGGLTVGVGSGSALPLELLYFTGAKDNGVSHLSWATATEINTSHFVVERSRDGINFGPIGQVAAAGNSNQELVYDFDDNAPMTGNNYYRLRMVDLDASYTYSNIINLTYDVNFGVDVFPNPFQSSVSVDIFTEQHSTSEATIELFDMLGRQVMNNTVSIGHGHNSFTLDNASLLTGTYTLKVTSGANVLIRKIVKDGQ